MIILTANNPWDIPMNEPQTPGLRPCTELEIELRRNDDAWVNYVSTFRANHPPITRKREAIDLEPVAAAPVKRKKKPLWAAILLHIVKIFG